MSQTFVSLASGCVVDASVLVKLVLPEEGSEKATRLMGATIGGAPPRRLAPDLIFHECANILWKRVRRGEFAAAVADTRLARLLALSLAVWPAQALVHRALSLAMRLDLSAYDAAYLALADLLDIPLVTADAALVRKAGGPNPGLVLLGDL